MGYSVYWLTVPPTWPPPPPRGTMPGERGNVELIPPVTLSLGTLRFRCGQFLDPLPPSEGKSPLNWQDLESADLDGQVPSSAWFKASTQSST